jgi:hypothetical protein
VDIVPLGQNFYDDILSGTLRIRYRALLPFTFPLTTKNEEFFPYPPKSRIISHGHDGVDVFFSWDFTSIDTGDLYILLGEELVH